MLHAPHDAAGAVGDCPHCETAARIPGGPPLPPGAGFLAEGVPVGEDELAEALARKPAAGTVAGTTGTVIPPPAPAGPAGPVTFAEV